VTSSVGNIPPKPPKTGVNMLTENAGVENAGVAKCRGGKRGSNV